MLDESVAESRRRAPPAFPLGRLDKPEDVARAILFLAPDDAAWIAGTHLTVDGGCPTVMPDLWDLREPA